MISGQPIEFSHIPYQNGVPKEKTICNLQEKQIISMEIEKILSKGVIIPTVPPAGIAAPPRA